MIQEVAVVTQSDFNSHSFIFNKLAPYLPPKSTVMSYDGFTNRALTKACKSLGVKLKVSRKFNKNKALPIFVFWDGADPMVKSILVSHLKAKVCVRVIRIDDEENVLWLRRNP